MNVHEESNICIKLRGGASIVNVKPVFSLDSKWLFCTSGDLVKVLSVSSGECVHKLTGHTAAVSAIVLQPQNQYQILTASLDGTVRKWEVTDGVLLRTFYVGYPLVSLMHGKHNLYALKIVSNKWANLMRLSLDTQQQQRSSDKVTAKMVISGVHSKANAASVGCKGSFVAAISRKNVFIYNTKNENTTTHKAEKEQLTCVACHPTEQCVATGTETGKIWLWYNIFNSNKASRQIRHWHALPVRDLHYTTDGSYLLSGGDECVLVKWQHGSTHRDTLPRLGAPIVHVTAAPDATHYSTSHMDNAVQVISSTFSILQHYQGLTRGHLDTRNRLRTGLMLDPRSQALVLNGRPGHLQFYDIHTDVQLFNLDIVGENYISPENVHRPLVFTEVETAAFDDRGEWLATVERRDDGKTMPEMKLKFWSYCGKTQSFVLNTSVDLPHDKSVSTLMFRPSSDSPSMAVTTSADGKFKLWQLMDDTDIYRENCCWTCESVGYYRDEPAGSADFSEDGTLLAVAFGKTLTLWDPETNGLRRTFILAEKIRHVLFGRGGNSCHLLMCATDTQLITWDLLTASVLWSEKLAVSLMLRQPNSSNVALFTQQSTLLVISPSDPAPIFSQKILSSTSQPLSAVFISTSVIQSPQLAWQKSTQLYFINESQELLTLTDTKHEQETQEKQKVKLSQHLPATAFSVLMAEKRNKAAAIQATQEEQHKHQQQDAQKFMKEMLSTPAHVMPPIDSLCRTFLAAVMGTSTARKSPDMSSTDSDDDSEDSEESESKPVQMEQDPGSEIEVTEMETNSHTTEEFTQIREEMFEWIKNM